MTCQRTAADATARVCPFCRRHGLREKHRETVGKFDVVAFKCDSCGRKRSTMEAAATSKAEFWATQVDGT